MFIVDGGAVVAQHQQAIAPPGAGEEQSIHAQPIGGMQNDSLGLFEQTQKRGSGVGVTGLGSSGFWQQVGSNAPLWHERCVMTGVS